MISGVPPAPWPTLQPPALPAWREKVLIDFSLYKSRGFEGAREVHSEQDDEHRNITRELLEEKRALYT